MKINRVILIMWITSIVTVLPVLSQSFVGKQRSIQISAQELTGVLLPEADEMNPQQIAEAAFGLSPEQLLQKLEAAGVKAEITRSTLYISGNKLRVDSEDPKSGKVTMLLFPEEGKFYTIMWATNEYMLMTAEQIKSIQKQAEEMQNQMMKNLPPEAMAAYQQMMGKTKTEPPKIRETGNTMTINNLTCKEVRIEQGQRLSQLWVSTQYPVLRKNLETLVNSIPDMSGDEEDIDKILYKKMPGAWPVVSKEFSFNPERYQGELSVDEMLSINQETVSGELFVLPSNLKERKMPSFKMPEGQDNPY